jgi:hypothetical protein
MSGKRRAPASGVSGPSTKKRTADISALVYLPNTEAAAECPISTLEGPSYDIPWLSEQNIAGSLPSFLIKSIQGSTVSIRSLVV